MTDYPKRLIEVDLPIKRISAHARREKSIRHGHISTLHIWWARRPLAACRAVLCAALWPDPADPLCPPAFRQAAAQQMMAFAFTAVKERDVADLCHPVTWGKLSALRQPEGALDPSNPDHLNFIRYLLLDFIADFSNWDASTEPHYLETARALTQSAHEALGGIPSTRPLVVDPFAGGGSIPLEALRVSADAFASDLNPVAVLLNKVALESIPKYGPHLIDEVLHWGQRVREEAEKTLSEFYPLDSDGAVPIAYLWARTITCEGPGCGAQVPLMRSFWLAKKKNRSVAMKLVPDNATKTIVIEIEEDAKAEEVGRGTVRRGAATCPVCGFTTPLDRVRGQLRERKGGTHDARLLAVVTKHSSKGTQYRPPNDSDQLALQAASKRLHEVYEHDIPGEPTPTNQSHRSVGSPWIYGMREWGDLFTERQTLALLTFGNLVAGLSSQEMPDEVRVILALCASKLVGFLSSLCMWRTTRTCVAQTFSRHALQLVWDFGEMNPFAGSAGDWSECVRYVTLLIEHLVSSVEGTATVREADATLHPLPDDFAHLFFTDPPYYDSVAYAQLSDFFYVWLKRALRQSPGALLEQTLTPKRGQAVVLHPGSLHEKTDYERKMQQAWSEGRRILNPQGIGTIVFAHKSYLLNSPGEQLPRRLKIRSCQ